MNQKSATNWSTTNKSVKAICNTKGSTCHSSSGPRIMASTGEVWMIFPTTTATTTSSRNQVQIRHMRNLLQSEMRRWVSRSMPPKTTVVQNR